MWISKKRWLEMERRIADLESSIQSQQKFTQKILQILKELGVTIV